MTTITVGSSGQPTIIEPQPSTQQHTHQNFFFQLPLPGQENKKLIITGHIEQGSHTPQLASLTFFESLRQKGYKIPKIFDSLLHWMQTLWKLLESASSVIIKCIGGPVKYLGLALLIAGVIHVFIVLFTTPPSAIIAGGLIVLIVALVTKGAVPVMLAGGTLFFFGTSLLKSETPAFHSFLNGFPIISYFMSLLPSNYTPNDPHHQS